MGGHCSVWAKLLLATACDAQIPDQSASSSPLGTLLLIQVPINTADNGLSAWGPSTPVGFQVSTLA